MHRLFQVVLWQLHGQLEVADTLDFESKPTLTVIIQVTDSEDEAGNTETNPVIDDTHTVTITVTNVFEAPRFGDDDGSGTATRTVPENTVADQNIGAPVSATDDEGDNLTYELGGTDASAFDFDTPRGKSRPRTPWTTRYIDSYSVTVSVSDGKANDGSDR